MDYISLIHPFTGFLTDYKASELKDKAILTAHKNGGKLDGHGIIIEDGRAYLNVQYRIGTWIHAERVELKMLSEPTQAAQETAVNG